MIFILQVLYRWSEVQVHLALYDHTGREKERDFFVRFKYKFWNTRTHTRDAKVTKAREEMCDLPFRSNSQQGDLPNKNKICIYGRPSIFLGLLAHAGRFGAHKEPAEDNATTQLAKRQSLQLAVGHERWYHMLYDPARDTLCPTTVSKGSTFVRLSLASSWYKNMQMSSRWNISLMPPLHLRPYFASIFAREVIRITIYLIYLYSPECNNRSNIKNNIMHIMQQGFRTQMQCDNQCKISMQNY